MNLSPMELFVDLGMAGILLLVGQLLRSRVRIVQRLFLPASVTGGCLGLALGPNGADLLPISAAAGTYPGILIGLVFATLPFASHHTSLRSVSGRIASLWAYSSLTILLQWGVGILFATFVLQTIWSDLNPGFGALLAGGFVGGHGTAAALGSMFGDLGWSDAGSLAMTSATVGILSSIVGGTIWVNWGSRRGEARFVTDFDQLPESLRTGLVKEADREAVGEGTFSSNSIDTIAFHLGLVAAAAVSGYFLTRAASLLSPQYSLPMFCAAYVTASALYGLMRAAGVVKYVDRRTMGHLGGALTDVLVVFGILSIEPAILVKYAVPLVALFTAGIVLCALIFRLLGPRFFADFWFERSLFTWGWVTGVTAMGIALLRIADPRNESDTLGDFGLAYLLIAPVEIGMVAVAPALLIAGYGSALAVGALVAAGVLMATVLLRGRQRPAGG